jgi:hypothetical protein
MARPAVSAGPRPYEGVKNMNHDVELDPAALELLNTEETLTGCGHRTECVFVTCLDADSAVIS